jgi:hypothetical protein
MMDPQQRTQAAIALMAAFGERTGLTSDRPQRRYLWTDAFAVCNLLGLGRATGEARYTELALRLVDRVHHTLGQHRTDDPRSGWISGLGPQQAEAHPTRGGLRIGKPLPERQRGAPFDEQLEWEQDGQYFHYLTRWMHALDLVTRATKRPDFNVWARELAETAYDAFTYIPPGSKRPRMYWKMSVDLSRPLVPSMGHHDPLDGYITYLQLQSTASAWAQQVRGPNIGEKAEQFAAMIAHDLTTSDPLGLGGLLMDAYRLQQLMRQGGAPGEELLAELLGAALRGLEQSASEDDLRQPAAQRLAFRELGLAIGLNAAIVMWQATQDKTARFSEGSVVHTRLAALRRYSNLSGEIQAFWLDPEHQKAATWVEHRDINEVMLATSLAPEGFLVLLPAG